MDFKNPFLESGSKTWELISPSCLSDVHSKSDDFSNLFKKIIFF